MNFSISSLSLAKVLNGPAFSSPLMQRGVFSLKNSDASRFASNFLRFSQFNGKAYFNNNRFSNFLSSALRFDKIEYSKQTINVQKSFDDSNGPYIDVKSCLFRMCETNGDGGGLSVSGETLTLNIKESSFFDCDSREGKGGGIYFDGISMYAKNTCFSYCESDNTGQAIFAQTTTKKNLYIEGCDVAMCTNVASETGEESAPIDLFMGKQRVKESNVTSCILSMLYSAFHTDDSDSIIMTFDNFEKNEGNIVIGIEDARSNDDLSYVNIINNKCNDPSTYGVVYATTNTVFRNVLFSGNTNLLVQSDVEIEFTFDKCVFDAEYGTANVTSKVKVSWTGCSMKDDPSRYKFSVFDTRYCWMIDPPKLSAGPATYWFLLVFFVFCGTVGYTTYLSWKRITSGIVVDGNADVNSNPLVQKNEVSYDSIK